MGRHIKQLTTDVLKESYKTQTGNYPTWLGEAFGWSGAQTAYNVCDNIHVFIDDLMPDFFPIGTVQEIMLAVLNATYAILAHQMYWDWAYRGDQLVTKFDEMITDYQSKINQGIAEAKALVERDFITPLRNQTTALQTQIASATAQLGNLNRMIDDAKKALSIHDVKIADLEAQIKKNPLENLFRRT